MPEDWRPLEHIDTINQLYKLPVVLKVFFDFMSIGSQKIILNNSKSSGENYVMPLKVWVPHLLS